MSLSEWGILSAKNGQLDLGEGVLPYSLNTPLFTDYAHKLRTIWMPGGMAAQYQQDDILSFPVGTVISKTFYYPAGEGDLVFKKKDIQPVTSLAGLELSKNRLIETRLLVRREAGWEPLSYVWNDEETEAKLTRIGDIVKLTLSDDGALTPFNYAVPNMNQCAGCHAPNNTTRVISPIGPKARHLNGDYAYAEGAMNQLDKWIDLAYLDKAPIKRPRSAVWDNVDVPLEGRVRAYLDINCAHCHNPVGPADTSGLHLNPDNQSAPHLGICKNAVAAGSGTGGRKYDIHPGKPQDSIMLYRMETRDPGAMMPELGRSLTHHEGAKLLESWIAELDSSCG
ncbi:SO2930 family diheme c-type cytochrome [Hellea balneolensis]|uniref:SO2930 family diheme c-type cytochrome n=1 Tax=Hellea balneolensis TaxID=287478 RepID=UPI001F175800|nr:SO2930 family diheme c-type cytochrome [Hellea balneolensis]